jgi:hypothetical protein
MSDWCVAHPWMTFWLVAFAIVGITNVVANICKTIIACRKRIKDHE